MGTAATTALTLGTTAFQAYNSYRQAELQNQAIEQSIESQEASAEIQKEQLRDQAEQRKIERQRRADQIRGRLRVAASEAGVGLGGSTAALQRQIEFREQESMNIIDQNLQNQILNVESGRLANVHRLESQQRDAGLSALTGGLSGLQTGLALGRTVQQANRLDETPEPEPIRPIQQRPFT